MKSVQKSTPLCSERFFHLSAQLAYTDLTANGNMIQKEDLERLSVMRSNCKAMLTGHSRKNYSKVAPEEKPEYNGVQLINSKVILSPI